MPQHQREIDLQFLESGRSRQMGPPKKLPALTVMFTLACILSGGSFSLAEDYPWPVPERISFDRLIADYQPEPRMTPDEYRFFQAAQNFWRGCKARRDGDLKVALSFYDEARRLYPQPGHEHAYQKMKEEYASSALQQLRDAKGHGDKARRASSDILAKDESNKVFDTAGKHNGEPDPVVAKATGSPVVPESIRRRPDYIQINNAILAKERSYHDLEAQLAANKEAREKSPSKKEADKLAVDRAEIVNKMARVKSEIGVDHIKREKIINLAAGSLEEDKPKQAASQAKKQGASSKR